MEKEIDYKKNFSNKLSSNRFDIEQSQFYTKQNFIDLEKTKQYNCKSECSRIFVTGMGIEDSKDSLSVIDVEFTNKDNNFTYKNICNLQPSRNTRGIDVNLKTRKIYVANIALNTVSIFDMENLEIIESVDVGANPFYIKVNPNTNIVYVANSGSKFVSAIDGVTNKPIKKIFTNEGAVQSKIDIDLENNLIYVSNNGTDNITVIDGITNEVIKYIKVRSYPSGIAVCNKYKKIYVGYNSSNSNFISILDFNTYEMLDEVTVEKRPQFMKLNKFTNLLYVSNTSDGTISVLDCRNDKLIRNFRVGVAPYDIAIDDKKNIIYVANHSSGDISVIRGNDNTLLGTIKPNICGCWGISLS
ncbi:MAG: YncE family protein [Clostridioides sp.]|nr:YncE family protein [Clostridioides sp.]